MFIPLFNELAFRRKKISFYLVYHIWIMTAPKRFNNSLIIFDMSIDNVIAKLMAALSKDHDGLHLYSFKDNQSACHSQRH